MKRCYIAGPMTGREALNFHNFFEAERRLRLLDVDVVNPARNQGGDTVDEALFAHGLSSNTWSDYLRIDLKSMLDCTRVYTLPGWTHSEGAKLEVSVAQRVGIQVVHSCFWDLKPVLEATCAA